MALRDTSRRLSILLDAMQRGFLRIDGERVVLVGYPLKLSPTERRLLGAICRKDTAIDELSLLLNEGVSRQNVAVHISSINRKAEAVSGRKLVIFSSGTYTINPFM